MQEITGDFFEYSHKYDAICCTINTVVKPDGHLVMGAGIALQFERWWPVARIWGEQTLRNRRRPHVLVTLNPSTHQFIVGIPTKTDYRNSSLISLVESSIKQLVVLADCLGWSSILLPRPGCGLGGLNWEKQVKPLLTKYLDERFTVISK